MIVALVVSRGSPVLERVLDSRILVWIGQGSYGVYLWHYPAIALGLAAGFTSPDGRLAAAGAGSRGRLLPLDRNSLPATQGAVARSRYPCTKDDEHTDLVAHLWHAVAMCGTAPDHLPAQARQRRLYEHLWAARDDGGPSSADLLRHALWKKHIQGRVLDVGAGDGLLARRFPQAGIVSLDLTHAGLVKVSGRAACSSAEQLAVRDGCFDTVVLSEVLEHVEDPRECLQECRRVLRTGGELLLSVPVWPIARTEAARHRRVTGQRASLENLAVWDPNHERRYDIVELRALLAEEGWRVVEEVPQFGELTCFALYWLEPLVARFSRRSLNFAHRAAPLDRLGRHSGVSLVLTPITSPETSAASPTLRR